MNNIFLISCLVFISSANLWSQIAIRPSGGANSTVLTKDFKDQQWRSALGHQLGVDVQLGSKFYFQPGMHWESLNGYVSSTDTGVEINYNSSHIRIPLTVGFRLFNSLDLINLRFYGGLDASFKLQEESGLFHFSTEQKGLKGANFGYHTGLGLDLLFFFVDGGYRWGARRLFSLDSQSNNARMDVFFVQAGIRIKL